MRWELILGYVIITLLFVFIIWQAINIPHAYFTWPDNVCIHVDSPNPEHSCENLPRKFHHHWSQP